MTSNKDIPLVYLKEKGVSCYCRTSALSILVLRKHSQLVHTLTAKYSSVKTTRGISVVYV